MKKFLSNFLLPILLLWNFVLHAQVYQALNIDGFNEDVIANGIGVATGSTTIDMDGVSSSLRSLDWQLTATSTPLASGLPIDGIIPSIEASTPGLFFRLQNYGQNNSIRLPLVNHTISSFVTEQVKAKKVFFLATAASGSARLGYRVIFDDNTIQEHEAIIPDWFNGTDLPIAYKGFGRLYRTNNFVEFSTTNPRLYQVAVNIDPANQTKNIKSVQFSHKGGAGILHVFAVSATLLEACPSPELVTFDLITSQTAKANFIAPISLPANGYKYEVRTSGLPESGTTGLLSTGYIASGSTTQNLVGLPSGTGVQFYIQSNCSAQSQESWKGPFSFTTTCEIQGTFYENFDNQTVGSQTNSSLPQCWGKIATDSGYLYVTNSSYYTGPNSLYVYNNNQVTGNLMLVSPETANLGQGGYQIRFRARAGASLGQTLKVVTLENPNTTVGMNLIEELQLTNSFKEYRINIPHGTHDYFGIAHGLNASYQAVFIDDIRFEPIPTCIVPTELTVSNVGIDRATIAWEASPSLNIEGYSYEIRTSGEAGSGNTGLAFAGTVNATATSVVLADLVTGTEYRVYVKANCGATDTSYWTDGAVFTPDWCKPTYANGSSNHRITTVNIGELGFTDHILSYTNRERMNITIPDFRAGNTYTFNVTTTGYTGMGVAIDFNNDGLFDQVNEVLALPNYISNDTQLYIANVAIPEGVTSGNYRMRIWNREANAGGGYGLDPCGSYNYGTWADYTVHIVGCASLLTLSASEYTICAHTSSPAVRILTGATDFDTLVWQPSIGISGNDLQGWVFNPAVSTVYELTASNSRGGGCTATVPVRITISTPPAPTAVDQTFCKKQNKKVQDLIATGENIKWYADETTTTALLPSTLVNNGTYYATQTVDGCESSVRMAINVVIEDPVLDAMTVATTFRYGTASQTILSLITGALGPYTLSWYEAETGGLSIPMPDFSTLSAGSHSYWVSTFSANGCESTRSRISLSILQMDIWVTANSRIKVYGDDDPEFTYTIFGSVNASVLTGSLSREIGEDRGNYVIQQGSLTASSNYNLNFSGGVLGIISAPVRVTADDQTKMEGTVDPVLTYQVSGLKNNETADDILTGSLTRTAGERAGMYPITQGTLGLSSPNYTLAYTPANLTITSTVLTVKADVQSKGYGDEDPILTYTVSGLDSNVQARDILTGSLSRAMGENTGTYAITQGTLSVSAGYTLQYEGADLTITPAVLTVTADAQTKIYGDTDPSLTYTVSELTFNDQITDVLTGSLARDAGEAIGAYSITQGTLGVSNNYTLRYVEEDLTITPAVLTVTANTQTKGYGDTDPALTYRVSGLKFNEQATAILTGSLVRVPGEAIGAYSITQGTLGVSNNYTLRYVEEDLTITPAVLTVTANTQTKGYGDADPALTYTVSGFKFNEKLEDILTGSLARDAGEARGIYAITQGTIQLAANYMLQYVGADLTITPSVLTVIADAQTKVYGDADPTLTYTVSGLQNNEQAADVLAGSLTRDAGEAIGAYAITQGSLATTTNYTLQYVSDDLTITPAVVTVTANAQTKVYGDADPTLTYTVSGLQNNEQAADVLAGSLTRDAGEAIGAYTITQGSLATTTNYTLQYVSDDLTITPAVLTVTANAQAKVYGDADPALTYTISGLKNNEQTVDVLMGALVRVLGEAVNTYLINQGSLTANSNYSVVYTTANFQITPAELIVNAIAKTKLYGDSDTVFNYTVDGLKRNEQKENVLSGRLSRLMGEDVGTYAMNQGSLVTNSNYTIVFHSADLTIIPAELVIIVDPKEKTYGDADPQWTYTFGGLVNNEQIENILTGELIRLPGENAGVYTIKQGTLISNGNYAIRFASADLTIQPAELIVNAEVKTKVYGDVDPTLTYTVSGLKNNEQAADVLAGSLTRDAGEAIGAYAITQGSLATTTNYTLQYVSDDLTITPAVVTVTANAQTKVYGDADPTLTYTVSGLQNNEQAADVLAGSLTRDAGEAIGSYAIAQGTLQASANYTLQYVGENLIITPTILTVTADVKTKVYGDADPTLTYTVSGLQNNEQAADVLAGSLTRDAGEAIGAYAITQGSLATTTNYTLQYVSDDLTITPAVVTVTANAQTKVYGGADPTLTYTVSGLENNDQATVVTGSLSRIAGESVNTYAINQGTIQASANYTLVFNPADFIITPALLTLTAEAKTKVYGDVDPALSYTVSGLENNDQATVVTGSLSRIAGESVNTYAINQGTLEASANYTLVFNPADFTITPALLSLAAEAKTKVYGDADPALTYRVSGLKLNDQATVVTGSLLRIAGESVNTYAINQGTLEASANYTLAFNAATFTITPALLTVNAEAKTKVYGDADPALTYTVSGLKNNDQATVVTGSLSRIAGESVNTYAINQGTLEASANYTLAFNPADFTITPALLTLTAEAKTKVYGDADPALTYTVSGLKNNDQITAILTGNLARIAGESVNTYPIHQGTLVASVNYTIVFQAGELTITPAELRLYPLVGQQKVYGQVDPMFQFTALGFKYSDTATTALTGGLGRRAGENVNLYVYTLGSLEALSSNYTLTISNQEKFEIKPAPLHIVVNPSQFKNYGAVDPAFTYTANGLQQGDYLIQAVAGNLSRRAGEEVGMYPLERGTLTPRANYYLASFVGANFEIKRAKINGLTLPSQTFVYDGQQKQLQIEGTLIPEATVTYTNNNQSQVGRYRVTALVNYGPSYEPLTLEGILTLTKANQQITWDELGQVVMEDTPTLQLEARASSSLAVSYTIDDPQDREVAEVDASGVVRFLQPGLVTITAHQTGDVNYNPAKSVSQFIEVTSRDASIWDLLVDGVSYGKIEKEFHLIIGCESQQEEIILAIKTQVGAEISPSNKITIPLTTYGKYEQVITVKSQNGQVIETYTIHIDKRIPTENIVFQKYENVLLVNNNKQTNGGYVFIAYQWFKNGVPIGEKQMYSAGDNLGETLDFGAEYQVELTLYNGTKLRSCPIVLGDKTQGNWAVYPNPVKKNQLLHVRVDETKQQTTNYVIYNVKGQTIKRGVLEIGNTGIEIPANVAAGSYFLVLKIEGKQQSVQFIVRE